MINTRKSFIPEMGDIEKSLDISRTSVLGGLLDYIKGKNDERVVNTLNILKQRKEDKTPGPVSLSPPEVQ